MTVRELQRRMDSPEFGEWVARERLEPSEPYRSDLRTALLCCTVANVVRQAMGTKKGRPFQIKDFLLKFEPQVERPPVEAVEIKMRSWLVGLKHRQGRKHG